MRIVAFVVRLTGSAAAALLPVLAGFFNNQPKPHSTLLRIFDWIIGFYTGFYSIHKLSYISKVW
jgi:hypothetical protein